MIHSPREFWHSKILVADIDPFLSKDGVGLSNTSLRLWEVLGLMRENAIVSATCMQTTIQSERQRLRCFRIESMLCGAWKRLWWSLMMRAMGEVWMWCEEKIILRAIEYAGPWSFMPFFWRFEKAFRAIQQIQITYTEQSNPSDVTGIKRTFSMTTFTYKLIEKSVLTIPKK